MASLFQEERVFQGKNLLFNSLKCSGKNGDIDWHDSAIEKQELEGMRPY